MKALLLCGYRTLEENEPLLGDGQMDRKISELRALGANEITIVLSGLRSDDYLRQSRKIHDCELVFDTHEQPGLLTNIRSGITGLDQACFILPIEIPSPDVAVWKMLLDEGRKATHSHLVQAIDALGAPWQSGFPLYLTLNGVQFLKQTGDLTGLVDARLKYLHQVFQHEADLAPRGVGL
jgi:hypothetical protein